MNMTKTELIHALHDANGMDEIRIAVGNPMRVVPVESAFAALENNGSAGEKRYFLLIGNFEPVAELQFTCRTCRGHVTTGQPNECPACGGRGKQSIGQYKRW
jgi:rubrerythrin